MLIEVFLLTLLLCTTLAIRINCDYRSVGSFINECRLSSLEVNNRSDTVTSVSGTLPAILNYKAIKILVINSSPNLSFLPNGLERFFADIETFEVSETGLTALTAADLEKFPDLTKLVFKENQIKVLDMKTFEFNQKIEEIDLSGNKLSQFSGDFLKFLPNLKKIDLSNNVCINETAENPLEILELRFKLSENCGGEISLVKSSFSFFGVCLVAAMFLVALVAFIKFVIKK